MSFLKISDPVKRDLIVKEFLVLKKNIRDDMISDRTGEQQIQTDLSKFFKPITETQKATTREITEGLKPIKEGITTKDKADTTYGLYDRKDNFYIGNKPVIINDNNIRVDGEEYVGTPGLWELIVSKNPDDNTYTAKDYENYAKLMLKTNTLHHDNNPDSNHPKANKSEKWVNLLSPIWLKEKEHKKRVEEWSRKRRLQDEGDKGYEGEGVIVIPSDPNVLLERLDLLLASQEASHTGVRNELVSICDVLKRQSVLDTKAYKKLNSIIKK